MIRSSGYDGAEGRLRLRCRAVKTHRGALGAPLLRPKGKLKFLRRPSNFTGLRPEAAMRQMQKVLWTRGVLLTPQHLQLQDRFLEDTLAFRLSSLALYPWGFSRIEVDREALAGGVFVLSAASGLFPDGLAFDFPVADTTPPPKPLEDR
jgi:hypothetical protein